MLILQVSLCPLKKKKKTREREGEGERERERRGLTVDQAGLKLLGSSNLPTSAS